MTAILLLSVLVLQPPQAPPLRAVSAAVPPQAPPVREVVSGPTYDDVLAKVGRGERLVVYAGVPLPTKAEPNAVRVDAIPGTANGVYDFFLWNGVVMMDPRKPAVVAAVTMVAGHQHTCPKCATTWEHANDDKSASHVCPNCRTVVTKKSGAVLIPVEVKPAPAKPKRISLNGRWYDEYPDGRLIECLT